MSLFDKLRRVRCRLCGKSTSRKNGRILINARSDRDMRSVIFLAYEEVSITLLNRLGVSLYGLDDIREDVYLCEDCIGTKLLPLANTYLDELKKGYLEKARDQPEANYYTERIGGIGKLGVPKALFLLVELYYLDRKLGPLGPFWIVELSTKLLKDGHMSWKTLEEPIRRAILESLIKKMESDSPSSWSGRLSDIESLIHSGVRLESEILQKVKEWESIAAHYLSTGGTSDLRWGANAEIGASHARGVLAKAKEIYAMFEDF